MDEVEVRQEPEEAAILRKWFMEQALGSPDTLDQAARLLIGLVTGLIGVLFAVLTVAEEPGKLPAYMGEPWMRWLGVTSIGLLLSALLAALKVALPEKITFTPARTDELQRTFAELLEGKSRWLKVATITFGLGVTALGVVLIAALVVGEG